MADKKLTLRDILSVYDLNIIVTVSGDTDNPLYYGQAWKCEQFLDRTVAYVLPNDDLTIEICLEDKDYVSMEKTGNRRPD